MKKLLEACDNGLVLLDVPVQMLDEAVEYMVQELVNKELLDAGSVGAILDGVNQQEALAASVIGHSLAVPHVYMDDISQPIMAIARLKHGINAGAPDGAPIQFVFLLLGPTGATVEHLDSLAAIARLMSDDEFHYLALSAKNPEEFRAAIVSRISGKLAADHHAAAGTGLQYTGKLFGGLIRDVRTRAKHYLSDFSDGLHFKTVASTFFLFFACLAPAIIFGGLMDAKTGGQIGAVEMIIATAACGLIYAIFAGQPLVILGGTGPMLIFTGILFDYCHQSDLPFLPTYAWVGFWTGGILLLMAATDASCLMKYFTRFTDEIFAALISLIFIYEAVDSLIHIFGHPPEDQALLSAHYARALLSLILAMGTFYVASSLSSFRKSHLLVNSLREFLADFGPTIAIIAMTVVAYLVRDTIQLDPLDAPSSIRPSFPSDPDLQPRDWLVPVMEAPNWVKWGSIIPALLCSVLVFLDQNITARLVNSPDNNLQKGESYHLDLAVVGILIAFCSAFGLPWLVAATVRSLNHVRSLATTEEVIDKSGMAHTNVLHVRENRLSGILIHLLVALSLVLLPWFQYIPMAVLFGLFLYMGIVSMKGNQFFERMSLWGTDPQLYPATHYIRRVPWRTIHLFTLVQLICLITLWVVKTSSWGILFPVFIALLVPIRFLLNRVFSPQHVAILDAEEIPEEESEAWT